MRKVSFTTALKICAVGYLFLIAGCPILPKLSEEDQLARIDDAGAAKDTTPSPDSTFPNTALGDRLRAHLVILALPAETLEEAEKRFDDSLAGLREDAAGSSALLSQAYFSMAEDRYYDRWAIVKTLADLESGAAYDSLRKIGMTPIPPERNMNTHLFSTQEEEIMIRLRAVDGLAALAKRGHRAANKDLYTIAVAENLNSAVRRRAIKGYLAAGSDSDTRAKLLLQSLPPELHGIVTLRPTDPVEFQKRVADYITIDSENTQSDLEEEKLPPADDVAPVITYKKGTGND